LQYGTFQFLIKGYLCRKRCCGNDWRSFNSSLKDTDVQKSRCSTIQSKTFNSSLKDTNSGGANSTVPQFFFQFLIKGYISREKYPGLQTAFNSSLKDTGYKGRCAVLCTYHLSIPH